MANEDEIQPSLRRPLDRSIVYIQYFSTSQFVDKCDLSHLIAAVKLRYLTSKPIHAATSVTLVFGQPSVSGEYGEFYKAQK